MAGKITINTERCKGCGLCVEVCQNNCIAISNQPNTIGYFTAEANNIDCTGCAMCAVICPETIIKVSRDDNLATIKPGKKDKPTLVK